MKNTADSLLKSMRSHKNTILLIIITVVATLAISSLISIWISKVTNLSFPTIGTIKFEGVEGYWDKNLTNKTETCDWRTISPGGTENRTIYLRSVSNIETTFNLEPENWTFWNSKNEIVTGPNSTTPYMNLTWNYNYTIVQPGETLQVTLTLSVDRSSNFVEYLLANDVKKFSVDIHISASGQG